MLPQLICSLHPAKICSPQSKYH